MNIQNLLGQMMMSNNPMQMLTSLLNPQQKQMVNLFKNQPNEKQAQEIANICNQNGINKEQLQQILNMVKKQLTHGFKMCQLF